MQNIIFHSDDYGISIDSSRHILSCCDEGVLGSVAILPNSPALSSCCQLLMPYIRQGRLAISVHLNLVEGKSLCPPEEVPLLTDQEGYFRHSFGILFLLTLSPKRHRLKEEIRRELTRQIQQIQAIFPDVPLALDSHQHFHMIPLVFDTVLEIIQELSLSVRYVRVSSEPLLPFLLTPSVWRQIRPINIVKNLLLNVFSWWDIPRLHRQGLSTNLFWGLIFSGDMNLSVIEKLLPKFQSAATRRGLPLEILSHPCPITNIDECLDRHKKGFVSFYFSHGRYEEERMLKSIKI